MPLIAPQFGIFAQGTQAHYFVELDLLPGVTGTQAIASFKRMRSPEVAAGGVNLVVAFRGELWREVAPSHAPLPSAPFRGITTSDGRGVPATPHDAWIWISGATSDVIWDHTRAAVLAVADVATVASERQAFTYRDSRDLTGFIDGTQNPPVRRAADVALIPTGEPGEGGSHVLVMRWVHDLQSFHALPSPSRRASSGGRRPTVSNWASPRSPGRHISHASPLSATVRSWRYSAEARRTAISTRLASTS